MGYGGQDTIDRLAAIEVCAHHMAHPRAFVHDAFGVTPTEQQGAILDAIAPRGAHVTCRSGHGIGKTTSLAWLVLWFLALHDDCKIPATAPSSHQLFDLLWAEISKWHAKMVPFYKRHIELRSDRVFIRGADKTRFAVARTARRDAPEALQGFHAENLLFLVDEASGVEQAVFEVAEGAMSTPGARVLLTGNPTRSDGYFYDTFTRNRDSWHGLHFSSVDSPLVAPEFAANVARRYGVESNVYAVRVLGNFPSSSDDVLIPLHWVESAVGRDIVPAEGTERVAGLDVARFGDDATALVVRHGGSVTHLDLWRGKDLMETCGRVAAMYRDERGRRFDRVHVDAIGIGAGVADRLKEMGIPVLGVNVAETAAGSDRFARLRDELWWLAREFFEGKKARIAPDCGGRELCDALVAELSTVRYSYMSTGKIKAEGKDEMKKRGLDSPNLADAMCLTFAEGRAAQSRLSKLPPAVPVSYLY